jgi:hypothetical protein
MKILKTALDRAKPQRREEIHAGILQGYCPVGNNSQEIPRDIAVMFISNLPVPCSVRQTDSIASVIYSLTAYSFEYIIDFLCVFATWRETAFNRIVGVSH